MISRLNSLCSIVTWVAVLELDSTLQIRDKPLPKKTSTENASRPPVLYPWQIDFNTVMLRTCSLICSVCKGVNMQASYYVSATLFLGYHFRGVDIFHLSSLHLSPFGKLQGKVWFCTVVNRAPLLHPAGWVQMASAKISARVSALAGSMYRVKGKALMARGYWPGLRLWLGLVPGWARATGPKVSARTRAL